MNKLVWAVLIVLIGAVVAAVVIRKQQSETVPTIAGTPQIIIAVIPKGTTHMYWKSVEAGARQAEKDFGIKVNYKSSVQEDDRAGQISVVQGFISDNVNGIVLAPVDNVALAPVVQAAMQKKIPVIIIDSSVNGDAGKDYVCYVGTNNRLAGKMGGEELAKSLGGKGKYLLLRYAEGSASTMDREQGFLDAMAENPGMKPEMANFLFAGTSVSEAQKTAMNLLDDVRNSDGIFCPNESTTVGMLNVLEQNHLTGKIRFVGFDATPSLVDALKAGELDALVSQNPTKMGYQGVKACLDYIKGQPQQPIQDSGVQLITRDNLNTPDVQKLLAGG
jgi:ribose transport system substrate-binding protein